MGLPHHINKHHSHFRYGILKIKFYINNTNSNRSHSFRARTRKVTNLSMCNQLIKLPLPPSLPIYPIKISKIYIKLHTFRGRHRSSNKHHSSAHHRHCRRLPLHLYHRAMRNRLYRMHHSNHFNSLIQCNGNHNNRFRHHNLSCLARFAQTIN